MVNFYLKLVIIKSKRLDSWLKTTMIWINKINFTEEMIHILATNDLSVPWGIIGIQNIRWRLHKWIKTNILKNYIKIKLPKIINWNLISQIFIKKKVLAEIKFKKMKRKIIHFKKLWKNWIRFKELNKKIRKNWNKMRLYCLLANRERQLMQINTDFWEQSHKQKRRIKNFTQNKIFSLSIESPTTKILGILLWEINH